MEIAQCLVLYVDDDPDDIEIMEVVFNSMDRKTTLDFAADYKTAISKINHYAETGNLPVIIIIDLYLGRYNAVDLLRYLKSKPDFEYTKVVVMSTSQFSLDSVKELSLHNVIKLTKESSIVQMVESIERLLPERC